MCVCECVRVGERGRGEGRERGGGWRRKRGEEGGDTEYM